MLQVDVAGRAHHVQIGLILLRHHIPNIGEESEGILNVRFVRNGLRYHNDVAPLRKFIREERVTVNGFTRITNEHEPGKRTVARHVLVFTCKHGWIDHTNLR